MFRENKHKQKGILLIEAVVGIAIFIMVVVGILEVFTAISKGVKTDREQTTIAALADQYMEIARNLPYSQVGTLSGNPHGSLPDQPNAISTWINGSKYKIYYDVTYISDPADPTPDEPDYKQVKIYVLNSTSGSTYSFLTTIVPKGLITGSGGALVIDVFDANGNPVSGATISITNTSITPNINLSRTSGSNGTWTEVGLPASANSYHIVVTKSGYSTDQSYPSTQTNPNPTKPDATIATSQITQVGFSIDLLSALTVNTENQTCGPLSSIGVELKGSKQIGTSPTVLKFDNTYTSNSSGQISLNPIEWDTYTPYLTGSTYMIYGSSPIQQVTILPSTSQTFSLILGPKTTNSLLAIVKDSSTGNPIEGATVTLSSSSKSYNSTGTTGGSVWSQINWTGGSGQATFTDPTKYFSDNGSINPSSSGVQLAQQNGSYASSGSLISSSFDSGSSSTSYTTLNWNPTSQSSGTTAKFQVASNNDNATWNFTGPDGTSSTYYTVPGTTISSVNNGNRYIRYEMFLSTTNSAKTPIITGISVNYVAGCYTPGQTFFPSLSSSNDYQAVINATGYQSQTITGLNISGNQVLQEQLTSN